MFCTHQDVVLATHRFDSIVEMNHHINAHGSEAVRLLDRGVITVVKCMKCSKVRHIKTILK